MSNNKLKIFGIMAAVIFIIAAGITVYGFDDQNNTNNASIKNSTGFPPKIQDMQLMIVTSGPEAVSMISELHGTDIKIKEGYILTYSGLKDKVMMWISESANDSEAKQLFKVMDDKIIAAANKNGVSQGNGGPPFYNRRTLNQSRINVVAVEGMDMENYYYQVGAKVYWIAISAADPLKILGDVIDRF